MISIYQNLNNQEKYKFITLSKKKDFDLLKISGVKYVSTYFIVVKCHANDIDDNIIYYSIKATKRVGNAVIRNKIKRRLRVLLITSINRFLIPSKQMYLCIGRTNCEKAKFDLLEKDMAKGIIYLNKK